VVNAPANPRESAGFRLIIGYKFVKAALMLGVALWLTTAPGAAFRTLNLVARDLAEGGLALRASDIVADAFVEQRGWSGEQSSPGLDSVSSAVEAVLLLSGKTWAQWVVIVGLACLIPFEILSIEHRPGIGKFLVLGANAAIVAYLAWVQMRKTRA